MATALKGFKLKLYPTSDQQILFRCTFGCTRFVWNKMFAMQIARRKNNPKQWLVSRFDMDSLLPLLKKEYPWLKDIDATALQMATDQLADAYTRFFKGQNGFPHFRKRTYAQSYTSKCINNNIQVVDDHHLKLPKAGLVYFKAGRLPAGKIKRVTIRQKSAGHYEATVLCECEIADLPKTGKSVGGDLGLKALLILSDGQKEPNLRYDKQLAKKKHQWEKKKARRLLGAQAEIARDKHEHPNNVRTLEDFKNYQEARTMVAKYAAKEAYQRQDQLQKYTTWLVQNYDLIVLEELNVKGLLKNHKLARAISNASWGRLVAILAYKCRWYGKELILVPPAYTSQECSSCHERNQRLGLSQSQWLGVREWDCPSCGTHHDRDINAAINILNKGIKTAA